MSEHPAVIALIEDELPIRRFLHTCLTAEGYRVHEAENGVEGLQMVARQAPHLLILDLGLPDMDGVRLIERLREWSGLPVLVLSARDQEKDKVAALDAGADDYLVKPFGVSELLARVRVALRHAAQSSDGKQKTTCEFGDIVVDAFKREVRRNGQAVHLTPLEYDLLALLCKHAGKVLTHRQLLREIWGPAHIEHSHYLRIYMGQLRHKLEIDPAQPRFLITETGVGYRLQI